jgi:hypothetical protein
MVLDTAEEVANATESLAYYLLLRVAGKQYDQEVELPEELDPIAELLTKLPPVTELEPWARIRIGKIAPETKAKDKKKPSSVHKSNIWTDAINNELVHLVEDEAYRHEKCGDDGTRLGQPNFAAIARFMAANFETKSSGGSIKSHYYKMKGIEAPATQKKRSATGNGEDTSAKKQKSGDDRESTDSEPSSSTGTMTEEQKQQLVKIVESEKDRRQILGKSKLKWSRVVDFFDVKGMEKKELKKLYTEITGKLVPKD